MVGTLVMDVKPKVIWERPKVIWDWTDITVEPDKSLHSRRVVALIPARSQSKRIPNKNIYILNGHPLLAYSIQAAKDSGIFNGIYVSSDSQNIGWVAEKYGAEFVHCPLEIAHKNLDPDIKWVRQALEVTKCDIFSILRPTSPFRTGYTIKRAWQAFNMLPVPSSIRAVEKCRQHPYKMWTIKYGRLEPLIEESKKFQLFNTPYQSLPEIYIQNASLEMSWSNNVYFNDSISGDNIRPFFTEGYEGFDINYPQDLREAEYLVSQGVEMPEPQVIK